MLALNRQLTSSPQGRARLSPIDPELLRRLLRGESGFALGATIAGELVAYRLVQLPRAAAELGDNPAYRGFPELRGELDGVARFAGIAVAPPARGLGLGAAMCELALTQLRARMAPGDGDA